MSTPALELTGVSLARRGLPVLEDVSLVLERHDYLAILGPNGSGKTTLLKVILGLLQPDRGQVRVLGRSPADARGRLGYVPQRFEFDLDFPIRVLDVALMGRLAARPRLRPFTRADRERAHAALARVEMADLAGRPIGTLSGGQLQRVLIARALAMQPELLLLDEPTASLDGDNVRRVELAVADYRKRTGAAVLWVSHDEEQAGRVAGRQLRLVQGNLVER